MFFFSKTEINYKKFDFYPTFITLSYIKYNISSHYDRMINYSFFKKRLENNISNICITNEEMLLLKLIFKKLSILVSDLKKELLANEKKELKKLIKTLDKDKDGKIDLLNEDGFDNLLNKHQKQIAEIDKKYIQKFVKISVYLKSKKKNTQNVFELIKDFKYEEDLQEVVGLLKNQIHTYELLIFHSVSMITSLIKNDLITFYEIYECFDQLGVFNSNWENEVSKKLTNIGDDIIELMYSINQMESTIVNSIDNLTYVTKESFKELSSTIESELSSINSSIKFNNLLSVIQTYQMYKINKNTKGIE